MSDMHLDWQGKKRKAEDAGKCQKPGISGIKQHLVQAPDRTDGEYPQPSLPKQQRPSGLWQRSQASSVRGECPSEGKSMDEIPVSPLSAKPNTAG